MIKCFLCVLILYVIAPAIASEKAIDEHVGNEKKWVALGFSSYRYTIQKSCFCSPEYLRITQVSVVNGEIVSASYLDSDDKVPVKVVESLLTMPEWFEKILGAIKNKQGSIEVRYDNQLGYPASIEIDMHKRRADDELSVLISDVVKQ